MALPYVAEIAGKRHLIGLDKGHKLEIRQEGGEPQIVESRPVTEFSAAVDEHGRLHAAAWLLSRHLMYYSSQDGCSFARSTLIKSDGGLRLKDCLIFADTSVTIAYVAETDFSDTLVCYRREGDDWEGRRVVEVEHPQRLAAYHFDGPPGGLRILYGVKEPGRTTVFSRPAAYDAAPETVATVTGALTDFCALTVGGARQACWLADGHMVVNGLRQTEEAWTRSFPHIRRVDGGAECLWIEDGALDGVTLGAQRMRLRPLACPGALPCMLALPGDLRRAVVDGRAYRELSLMPEIAGSARTQRFDSQQPPGPRGREEHTLTDAVRNQAVYLTRMQESLGNAERNLLRMQSEVNRLSREVAALMKDRQVDRPKPASVAACSVEEVAGVNERIVETIKAAGFSEGETSQEDTQIQANQEQ